MAITKSKKLKRKLKKKIIKKGVRNKIEKIETPAVHKIKKYKAHRCDFVSEEGIRCKKRAIGKGTLCKEHGGNPIVKENLIPVATENFMLVTANKFNPAKHPIEYIALSRQGFSEVEIAATFQVSINSIKRWAEKFESFALAYEIGQAMHETWWIEQGKLNLNSRSFNTNLFKFMTSNKLGYSDKMETKATNLNIHGVLVAPDTVTEEEWENEDIIDVDS